MNIKQMKSMLSKFRSADVSLIKDADMRAKAEKLQAKQGGFTLLELLVVVAILAIIAGAVISSLDGQEELAAQKTTVHTMAALEENFQIYRVSEKRNLPGSMDSLICSDAIDASAATATITQLQGIGLNGAQANATTTILGAPNNSNVPRVGGGLTADLAGNLTVVDVSNGLASRLVDAGLTSLRYAELEVCDTTADNTSFDDEPTLVEHVKPNLIFQDPLVEDGEFEFGGGQNISFNALGAAETIPMAVLLESGEITRNESDIVAVFGIGPGSEIVGEYVARAPSDGNTGPDKYSNFSVAVKIAECPAGDELGDAGCGYDGTGWLKSDIKVVGILDGGGDAYDDEVAEARGNQEE